MAEKNAKKFNEDSDDGKGGKSGEVEFTYHNPLAGTRRDDLLPENEKNRLLKVHQSIHKDRVIKQKQTREQRAAVREGRQAYFQSGLGSQSLSSSYKTHPISNKAQFAGIDRQNQMIPTENIADTNQDARKELQLQHQLQYQPDYTPNPKNRLQLQLRRH